MARPRPDYDALYEQVVADLSGKGRRILALTHGIGDQGIAGLLCATDDEVWFYGFFLDRKIKKWAAECVWTQGYGSITDFRFSGSSTRGYTLVVCLSNGIRHKVTTSPPTAEDLIMIMVDKTSYAYIDLDGQRKLLGGPSDVDALTGRFNLLPRPKQGSRDPGWTALKDRYKQGFGLWEGVNSPSPEGLLAAGPLMLSPVLGSSRALDTCQGDALLTNAELVLWWRPFRDPRTPHIYAIRAQNRDILSWNPNPGFRATTRIKWSKVAVYDSHPRYVEDVTLDASAILARGAHQKNTDSLALIGTQRALLATLIASELSLRGD